MKLSRTTIVSSIVLTGAAAAAIGAVALAANSGGSSLYAGGSGTSSTAMTSSGHRSGATVHTAITSVQGTRERILVDAAGDPLYTYKPDTATKSLVSGQLAVLWPPLVAKQATVRDAPGKLTTVPTTNGQQVAYNGHFLYTFVQDKPGQVTGQGVEDFFVATPDLKSSTATSSAPAAAAPGMGY
jgi:predicted lipoprotein with Yx(FWY)xxD motif